MLLAEIVDQIIDDLHDDRKALQACTLVCKSWQPRSRYHLWTTMSATPEKGTVDKLVAFLTSTTDISQRIECFTLSGYQKISFTDLEAILIPLTSLRTLSMNDIHISRSPSSEIDIPSGPVVVTLTTLRIMDCNTTEQGVDILFRLLSLFGDIKNLYLSTRRARSVDQDLSDLDGLESRVGFIFPPHVHIYNLSFGSLPPHILAQLGHPWSSPFWDSIDGFSVEHACTSWVEIKQLGKVFSAHGARFRRVAIKASHNLLVVPTDEVHNHGLARSLATRVLLSLGLPHLPPIPDEIKDTKEDWRALRLRKCSNLDVFTVTLDHSDKDGHQHRREILSTTVDLLTHLPRSVREVRIIVIPDITVAAFSLSTRAAQAPKGLLEDLDWTALDDVLSAPKFKHLRVVLEIVMSDDFISGERYWKIVNNIRRALPLLSSRGMLVFDKDLTPAWTCQDQ